MRPGAHLDTETPTLFQGIRPLDQYVLHPPVRDVRDAHTGIRRYSRFSCVGFVLDCYENGANIRLLDWDSPNFPTTELPALLAVYDFLLSDPMRRAEVGLTGPGPWPVALPGHLFHSLRRWAWQVRRTPYVPKSSDEVNFPPAPAWYHRLRNYLCRQLGFRNRSP